MNFVSNIGEIDRNISAIIAFFELILLLLM